MLKLSLTIPSDPLSWNPALSLPVRVAGLVTIRPADRVRAIAVRHSARATDRIMYQIAAAALANGTIRRGRAIPTHRSCRGR